MSAACDLCPHKCVISEEMRGMCKARKNESGIIKNTAYGLLTSLCLDPIEKKPLARFHPGKMILSAGSFGCNMKCAFCQNWQIADSDGSDMRLYECSPEKLVQKAMDLTEQGNIGIAYTYNEPLINYEYVEDCARLAHKAGLINVLVTNGMINHDPFAHLLKWIDAANIDLKGFSPGFYKSIGGDLDIVKENIRNAANSIHVEITTLVIEGLNDNNKEMQDEFEWIAKIDEKIPLHLSRFFPQHKMADWPATSSRRIYELMETAKKYIMHVYPGNM